MTKERRLAIKMWKQIVKALMKGEYEFGCADYVISCIKHKFCNKYNLEWRNECWFCQYVRQDWRKMPSRINISVDVNGCQCCPLYKEHADILDHDECGCTNAKETLWMKTNIGDVDAARRILELLKGKGVKRD